MDALIGITFQNFLRLMSENRFSVDKQYRNRGYELLYMALRNSYFKISEDRKYKNEIQKTSIQPPIFILGHWRSGTTLLHSLLSLDEQYAFPTLFQVSKPFTFLIREPIIAQMFSQMSSQKRPMDNLEVSYDSPGEDEFALSSGSLRSPMISWSFPRREKFYERFLSFKEATEREKGDWTSFLRFFLKKLSYRYPGRKIILKSPTHTARISLLLELFPDAKFVHIHRNPYTVFRSTLKLYNDSVSHSYLQNPAISSLDEGIIRRYKIMYDSFFNEYPKIPCENYYDLAFENLENDLVGEVRKIYEALNLPGFNQAEPKLIRYAESSKNYQKNRYSELEENIRKRIYINWRRNFEIWGYKV